VSLCFLIKLIDIRRLFILIDRIDFIGILFQNVIILGVLVNSDHDLAVNIIVCVWIWQNYLELRVVSDVQDDFGGNV